MHAKNNKYYSIFMHGVLFRCLLIKLFSVSKNVLVHKNVYSIRTHLRFREQVNTFSSNSLPLQSSMNALRLYRKCIKELAVSLDFSVDTRENHHCYAMPTLVYYVVYVFIWMRTVMVNTRKLVCHA